MGKTYNKLVRDNIPKIIEYNNETPTYRVLNGEEFAEAIEHKLDEEVNEFKVSRSLVELADILEVVEALAKNQGSSFNDVLKLKAQKQIKIGAFNEHIFLETVEENFVSYEEMLKAVKNILEEKHGLSTVEAQKAVELYNLESEFSKNEQAIMHTTNESLALAVYAHYQRKRGN